MGMDGWGCWRRLCWRPGVSTCNLLGRAVLCKCWRGYRRHQPYLVLRACVSEVSRQSSLLDRARPLFVRCAPVQQRSSVLMPWSLRVRCSDSGPGSGHLEPHTSPQGAVASQHATPQAQMAGRHDSALPQLQPLLLRARILIWHRAPRNNLLSPDRRLCHKWGCVCACVAPGDT